MKNPGINLATLIGGMIIGSAVTMLCATDKGKEFRRKVKAFVKEETQKMKSEISALHCSCAKDAPEEQPQ